MSLIQPNSLVTITDGEGNIFTIDPNAFEFWWANESKTITVAGAQTFIDYTVGDDEIIVLDNVFVKTGTGNSTQHKIYLIFSTNLVEIGTVGAVNGGNSEGFNLQSFATPGQVIRYEYVTGNTGGTAEVTITGRKYTISG